MTRTSPWAYSPRDSHVFDATAFTIGPWSPEHQHAGPPSALVCRAIEQAAAAEGLTHVGRLTGNLLRPVPVGEMRVEVAVDYVGRNAGHYSARLLAAGKEVARYTALVQREDDVPVPAGTPGHPLPHAPRPPADSEPARMPFATHAAGYGNLIENRLVAGTFFNGPCTAWFRMRHPLVAGETPSPYQRVVVAADSGNGISAAVPFKTHVFVNSDLSIHLLRRPRGEWVCLEARTALGGNGCGLAESALYDEHGLIGRAVQSLAVRARG
ncbi:MAG: thioesterase family protein [Rubrivivax sp.]|nr:thioesterase family protein [Rubrivivax sp.]